jgi:hypothetical protein
MGRKLSATGSFLGSWGPAGLIVVGVGMGAYFQAKYADPADPADREKRWLYLAILGVVLAAATPVVDAAVRQRQRTSLAARLKKARTDEVAAVNDGLDPLVDALGVLVTTERADRPAAAQRLLTQALNSASQVIGSGRTRRVRVSYFEPDENGCLVCRDSAGREGRPRSRFCQDDPEGASVIERLADDATCFCESIADQPPAGWDPGRVPRYQTFISVPARVGRLSVGMLTADAPNKGELQEQDIPLLRVIGTILAASIRIKQQGEDDDARTQHPVGGPGSAGGSST